MCLFLLSACFGRLCAHHQEEQLCFCDTWYLSFYVDDSQVCRVFHSTLHIRQSSKLTLFTKQVHMLPKTPSQLSKTPTHYRTPLLPSLFTFRICCFCAFGCLCVCSYCSIGLFVSEHVLDCNVSV